jgi:hypothetical protein
MGADYWIARSSRAMTRSIKQTQETHMADNYGRERKPDPRFGKFTEAEVEAGTDAGTGRGNAKLHESSGIVDETVAHGQTVKRAHPLDTSDMTLPNEHGMDGFRGGPTNLSTHSLEGGTAVMGPHDGNESPYIPNH